MCLGVEGFWFLSVLVFRWCLSVQLWVSDILEGQEGDQGGCSKMADIFTRAAQKLPKFGVG